MQIVLWLGLVVLLALNGSAVELDDVKDGDCGEPTVQSDFDESWATTGAPEWYHPLLSKYYLYRLTSSLQDVTESKVTEDQAERSCPIFTLTGNTGGQYSGYAGTRKLKFDSKSGGDPGVKEITYKKPDGFPGKRSTSYITLTDNKSYYVSVTCWGEGQRSFAVASTKKTLEASTLATIRDHLTGLGFEAGNFQELNYDNCITLPPKDSPATPAPRPPAPGDGSTGNSNSSGPLSGLINIIRTKIDFLRGLIMTVIRFLTAPIRFITQTLGNLGLRRGGADRG